jgi:hypothetical protein
MLIDDFNFYLLEETRRDGKSKDSLDWPSKRMSDSKVTPILAQEWNHNRKAVPHSTGLPEC